VGDEHLRRLEREAVQGQSVEVQWDLVRALTRSGVPNNEAHRRAFGIGPQDAWARVLQKSGYLHLVPSWPEASLSRSACSRTNVSPWEEPQVVDLELFRQNDLGVPACSSCRRVRLVYPDVQADLLGVEPWICRAKRHSPWPMGTCPNCGVYGASAKDEPEELARLQELYDQGGPVERREVA
jgi:hypothetical protein